ncbi:hypothetical protein BWQ96_01100 [Gracilariopsis chorda]|uniref:Uncharacterized protein n=1 Tax=Gracilariopsis chorda TaxID=448386 RepID=A0A2V3J3X1_9FLOR|nr:hypothetical protein BWQ96_01100 [Gracilariopsis chorda]|eukprot:PXF49151.1 hypothetical protein BWQ96_01100 [Gracilariopsis chorda]
MPRPSDPRLTVGNVVNTRATLITSDAECKRLFGSIWKTKCLIGNVVNVVDSIETGRHQTSVTVARELPIRTKRCFINLCSLKMGTPEQEKIPHVTDDNTIQPANDTQTVTEIENAVLPANYSASATGVGGVSIQVHERVWTDKKGHLDLNGSIPDRLWKVIGPAGDIIVQNHTQYVMQ